MINLPFPLRRISILQSVSSAWHKHWAWFLLLLVALVRVYAAVPAFRKQQNTFPNITWLWGWKDFYCQSLSPYDSTGLARAIFLGDPKLIPYPVKEIFHLSGLSHIVAASGYNCVIVSIIFVFICRIILRSINKWNQHVYYVDIAAAIGSSWLFWLWSEQSPPITRAAIYITVTGILKALFVKIPLFRIVLLQYVLSIILVPILWQNPSFQLTFFCLFSLFLAQSSQKRLSIKGAIPTYLFTNLCVCLGVFPITWFFFGEVNLTGILTNWIAVPPVTFFIMPLSLFAMALCGLDWAVHSSLAGSSQLTQYIAHILGSTCDLYFHFLKFWFSLIPHLRYAPYYQ